MQNSWIIRQVNTEIYILQNILVGTEVRLVNLVLVFLQISDDKKCLLVLNEGLVERLKDLWLLYKKSEACSKDNHGSSTETDEEDAPLCLEGREEIKMNLTDEETFQGKDDEASTLSSSSSFVSKVCFL